MFLKDRKGFTLIELIVGISILGIMTAIAVPSIIAWMPSIRIKNASNDLSYILITARYKAISESMEYRVLFNPATNRYLLDRGNAYTGSNVWTTESGPDDLPSGITYTNSDLPVDITGSFVCLFGPNGKMTNFTGNTHFIDIINENGKVYRIEIVSRTGHVKIKRI